MSAFIDEFSNLINEKLDRLKYRILKGRPNPLEKHFVRYMNLAWQPLDGLNEISAEASQLKILAVDSSSYTTLLSNGGLFYIVCAMAVWKSTVYKKLEADVIFSKYTTGRIREFITAKMEMMEFEVALEALRSGFRGDAILLDGSLYGRASRVPLESRVEEEREAMLNYYKLYKELLDLSQRSRVLLAGISKESRSTFYRDHLLKLIFEEKLGEIDIDETDRDILGDVFYQVLENEGIAFERFYALKQKYGDRLEIIEQILRELASSRPDYQLIINYISGVGYMRPLLLGPRIGLRKLFVLYQKDPREYVKKHFPRMTLERGESFILWASEVLREILDFPSFVSFYILLHPKDSPIRIDVPYYGRRFADVGWPEPIEMDLDQLLRIMVTGYCGLDAYNVWLRDVDQRVRLNRKIVDDIYFPIMEKLFGEKIIHGRSHRRVKYP